MFNTTSDLFAILLARATGGGGGGGGTSDYSQLSNKPKINNVELDGNKSLADIGAQPAIDSSHKLSADNVDDTNATNKFATTVQLQQIEKNKNNILTANAELIELVDNGAKNLFLPTAESKTNPTGFTGTITNNGDGSYTINGTAGSSPYYLKLGTINLKAGNYVLYARPTQQSGFYVYNDGAWTDSDVNDNRYATFATDTTQNIYLRVDSNATVSNYTIYPMICYKSAWDVSQKYVPYAMTNAEITAWIQAHT